MYTQFECLNMIGPSSVLSVMMFIPVLMFIPSHRSNQSDLRTQLLYKYYYSNMCGNYSVNRNYSCGPYMK